MRVISFLGTISLFVLSSLAFAQQASGPSGTPTPYPTNQLPQIDTGPGRDVPGPNDTTKSVKAVPCGTAAHETDGSTTCVGIPDSKKDR